MTATTMKPVSSDDGVPCTHAVSIKSSHAPHPGGADGAATPKKRFRLNDASMPIAALHSRSDGDFVSQAPGTYRTPPAKGSE